MKTKPARKGARVGVARVGQPKKKVRRFQLDMVAEETGEKLSELHFVILPEGQKRRKAKQGEHLVQLHRGTVARLIRRWKRRGRPYEDETGFFCAALKDALTEAVREPNEMVDEAELCWGVVEGGAA